MNRYHEMERIYILHEISCIWMGSNKPLLYVYLLIKFLHVSIPDVKMIIIS